jgi:hypothetical protein
MSDLVIAWLYVVGVGVTTALIRDVEHKNHGAAIALLWPVSIPLALALRRSGLLTRIMAWAERRLERMGE